MTEVKGWNPRFLAFCKAHNVGDPAEMLTMIRERFGGFFPGCFMIWIGNRWSEFASLHGVRTSNEVFLKLGEPAHAKFDEWLKQEVSEQ